jgi:hypothetical protein
MRDAFGYVAYGAADVDDLLSETDGGGTEEEEEEEEEEVDEVEACRQRTEWRADSPVLILVDFAPGLMFKDTSTRALDSLSKTAGGLDVQRLSYDEYEEEWADKLGVLSLFPAYVLAAPHGVFQLHGSFLHRMYLLKRVLEV